MEPNMHAMLHRIQWNNSCPKRKEHTVAMLQRRLIQIKKSVAVIIFMLCEMKLSVAIAIFMLCNMKPLMSLRSHGRLPSRTQKQQNKMELIIDGYRCRRWDPTAGCRPLLLLHERWDQSQRSNQPLCRSSRCVRRTASPWRRSSTKQGKGGKGVNGVGEERKQVAA